MQHNRANHGLLYDVSSSSMTKEKNQVYSLCTFNKRDFVNRYLDYLDYYDRH